MAEQVKRTSGASAAAPCPAGGELKEQQQFRDYAARIYTSDDRECLEVLRGSRTIYSSIRDARFRLGVADADEVGRVAMGTDVTGDGRPDLVVSEHSRGAHCCYTVHVFEIASQFRLVARIPDDSAGEHAQHSGIRFEDVDNDGKLEAICRDWTFAYWDGYSFADSPAPEVILKFRDGAFRLALGLMRKPPPAQSHLESRARQFRFRANWEAWETPPSALLGEMLDLIYAGNARSAWQLLDLFWPPDAEKKAGFVRALRQQLAQSPYWQDLLALNGGRL